MSSVVEQAEGLAAYLASGSAFGAGNEPGTVTHGLLRGLGQELLRSADSLETFKEEILPDRTVLYLDEWESAVGIPDECFRSVSGSDDVRRRNVLAKLASLGVQTAADMVALAALFGISAEIRSGAYHGTFPMHFPILVFFETEKAARHTIVVGLTDLGARFPYTFPLPFESEELGIVECLLRKAKPANVDLILVNLTL